MSDAPFLRRLLLACSRGSTRLFKNSVGFGLVVRHRDSSRRQAIVEACIALAEKMGGSAARVKYGLHEGSGDLIGWRSFVIQPEDVGRRVAVFASLEAKEGTGRLSPEQRNFRDQVLAAGGIAGEVRSVEDAERLLAGSGGPPTE